MAYDIVNSKRSKSTVRITGNTDTTITLSSLQTIDETISSATINHVITSGDGWFRVYRGDSDSGVLVLELYGSQDLPLTQYDISVANTATANIFVTNSGAGGTFIMNLSKVGTYANTNW